MDRKKELLRFVDKEALGVEIAPYFNPLTPKAEGFNCRIVDVFGHDELRAKAKDDPFIPSERVAEIEDVDFVGDGSHLNDLMRGSPEFGECAYIVSSHNFEHLPNPIQFLQGCEEVLRPGGVLSMAIPDYRACFDHFRFPTRLADWLDAYHEDRSRPSPGSVLDFKLGTAHYLGRDGNEKPGFNIGTAKFERFIFGQDLPGLYQDYLDKSETYTDAHCSVTCPEILHLLISDLIHLDLISFEIVSISRTRTFEYFVHLRKPEQPVAADKETYKSQRPILMNEARLAMGIGADADALSSLLSVIHQKTGLKSIERHLQKQPYVVQNG
mgnify:CR=1 FL=1